MRHLLSIIVLCCCVSTLEAQYLPDGLGITVEASSTLGIGHTPLWLNANRYGVSSLNANNGYVRANAQGILWADSLRDWSVEGCADLVAAQHFEQSLYVQQLFLSGRYKCFVVTLGQKQHPMQLKNGALSSGSQTLGINARPYPELRLSVPDYWAVPHMGQWLAIKGHLAYGWLTDGDFQADWTGQRSHYAQDVKLHTKAGYLRIGPESDRYPFSLELGLEMACEFGGTMYHTQQGTVQGTSGWRSYVDAFFAKGSDEVDATYHNVGGNHLGSWVARFNYDCDLARISLYGDHFFEDHSSMFLLDYDGYGSGASWDVREQSRYLFYGLKDMMWGLELQLHHQSWLKGVVLEYLDTRYQSGPIYHDHNPGMSDHIGGDDNYYNHYLYQGWSHWGHVMGNPLYRSPLYNQDHTLTIQNNRFLAWHLGLQGDCSALSSPLSTLAYRFLFSWQRGYGTYQGPLLQPETNASVLAELTYSLPASSRWSGCSFRLAWGVDHGELLGNNMAVQAAFAYRFSVCK